MASIVLTRPEAAPEDPIALSSGIVVPGGFRFNWRCRYSSFQTSVVSIPATRRPEGPFLRIYPAFNKLSTAPPTAWPLPPSFHSRAENPWHDAAWVGVKNSPGNLYSGFSGTPGTDGSIVIDPEDDAFYEIDALAHGSVRLPFAATYQFAAPFSGTWVWDCYWHQDSDSMPMAQQLQSQTRTIETARTRLLPVPFGAYRWRTMGQVGNIHLLLDGKGGGATTDITLSNSPSASSPDVPIANARFINATAGGASPLLVMFILQLP